MFLPHFTEDKITAPGDLCQCPQTHSELSCSVWRTTEPLRLQETSRVIRHIGKQHLHSFSQHLQGWWPQPWPGQAVQCWATSAGLESSLVPDLVSLSTAWGHFPWSCPLGEDTDPHLAAPSCQGDEERFFRQLESSISGDCLSGKWWETQGQIRFWVSDTNGEWNTSALGALAECKACLWGRSRCRVEQKDTNLNLPHCLGSVRLHTLHSESFWEGYLKKKIQLFPIQGCLWLSHPPGSSTSTFSCCWWQLNQSTHSVRKEFFTTFNCEIISYSYTFIS